MAGASSMGLAGPLLSVTGGTFTSGFENTLRAFISVLDGSTLSSTSTCIVTRPGTSRQPCS